MSFDDDRKGILCYFFIPGAMRKKDDEEGARENIQEKGKNNLQLWYSDNDGDCNDDDAGDDDDVDEDELWWWQW